MKYPVSDPGSKLYNGKFTDGDPAANIPASVDKAAHMNAVYDELTAVITGLGGVPSETVFNQIATLLNAAIAAKAPLASPAFTDNPTAPTQAAGNNSTRLANTAFVKIAIDALTYIATAGNADTVDGRHAVEFWRFDQGSKWGDDINGGYKLPNNLAFQYGETGEIGDGSSLSVTFPASFTAVFGVYATPEVNTNSHSVGVSAVGNSGFTVRHYDNSATQTSKVLWMALGRIN